MINICKKENVKKIELTDNIMNNQDKIFEDYYQYQSNNILKIKKNWRVATSSTKLDIS